jgi:adenosylhomocysteinase
LASSSEPLTSGRRHSVADLSLAKAGQVRIAWADGQMPVLCSIRKRFERERPLDGVRVAACLHVTSETANLLRTLIAGGAEAQLCASNPHSTQDDVAAALVEHHGVAVHAARGETGDEWAAHVMTLVVGAPHVTLDDGADLMTVLHELGEDHRSSLLGGTEETTTGLVRLRALEHDGLLRCPVLAVNESLAERTFNDRYGTGQSTLDGILRATNMLLAGRTVVVIGYGWSGKGVALRAKGAGASVVVCEVDPMRALEARMDGCEVMPVLDAATVGDVFITVTGGCDVLVGEHFERMKDGAMLANAGHFDVEIAVDQLAALATVRRQVLPLVEQFEVGSRRLNLLAQGRVVNLAAAEGHPAAVMDMSFANQALCVEHLVRHGAELGARVLPVPPEIDREVARLKLAALGVRIDELTAAQRDYLTTWRA